MATKNYVIGVGGAGARIMESIVRLCECGYIEQKELFCVMVDVDADNGNAVNFAKLVENYTNCYNALGKGANDHIFKTEILGASANNGFTAHLINKEDSRDSIIINHDLIDENDYLEVNDMKSFLSKKDYTEKFEDGFYGSTLQGTLSFEYYLTHAPKSSLNALLKRIVDDLRRDEVVKIYIAGSTFGGTGASGILPICKKLVADAKNLSTDGTPSKRENLHIFACLMTPYFVPIEEDKPKDARIHSEDFRPNSYYVVQKFRLEVDSKKNKIFNKIQTIGDTSRPIRGAYAEKGKQQANWPHICELFAAAEAGKFFEEKTEPSSPDSNRRAIQTEYVNPLKGDDMNDISDLRWDNYSGYRELREAIELFTLFNYYFSADVMPTLFDYHGSKSSKPFVIWPNKGKKKKDEQLKRLSTSNWGEKFLKDDGGILGFFGKKYSINKNIIDAEAFEKMYNYLTGSARWYYKLIHKFPLNDDYKPCWDKNADGDPSCKCAETADVLLKNLFGNYGTKKLTARSCLPKVKPSFLKESDSLINRGEENVEFLLDGNLSPNLLNNKTKMGDKIDKPEVFRELVSVIYTRLIEEKPT
ncbi:MAG: hypothetical protein FWG65_11560 [Turicibacter sp.]|nr:hypothetical protein [Turicibacter sp.]